MVNAQTDAQPQDIQIKGTAKVVLGAAIVRPSCRRSAPAHHQPIMPRSTAKDLERREKVRRVQEEYPLPKGGSIKEVDVLNTDAVILEGLFDLEQLEAIVRHMKALREP